MDPTPDALNPTRALAYSDHIHVIARFTLLVLVLSYWIGFFSLFFCVMLQLARVTLHSLDNSRYSFEHAVASTHHFHSMQFFYP